LFLFENIDAGDLYFLADFILPRKSLVSGDFEAPPPLLLLVVLNDDDAAADMVPYKKNICNANAVVD
jgi:hypothetical protein